MNEFIAKYRSVWGDDPRSLLDQYTYHPELTQKLDRLTPEAFGRDVLNEIVLWKLSRYPYIDAALIESLKVIPAITPKAHRDAEDLLAGLLGSRGIALPMASTILRFLNPHTFQIIDDRAYRVLMPGAVKYPATKPPVITSRYIDTCVEIYFRYLDELHLVASERLPFESADRILYQLDIQLGNAIGSKSSNA